MTQKDQAPRTTGSTAGTRIEDDRELVEEERRFIAAQRPPSADQTPAEPQPYAIGLALSGGGIRSAIVSLGVLQRLARARILDQVDYLSTVSGGGFIGTSLSWWMHQSASSPATAPFDLAGNLPWTATEPGQIEEPERQANILRHLRRNGKYLMPGNGHGIAAGVSVVLRSVFLNLLVWIPLVASFCLLLYGLGTLPLLNGIPGAVSMIAPDFVDGLNRQLDPQIATTFPPVYLILLLILPVVLVFFVIVSINVSVQSWMEHGEGTAKAIRERLSRDIAGRAGGDVMIRPSGWRWLRSLLVCLVLGGLLAALVLKGWPRVEGFFVTDAAVSRPDNSLILMVLVYFAVTLAVTALFVLFVGGDDFRQDPLRTLWAYARHVLKGYAILGLAALFLEFAAAVIKPGSRLAEIAIPAYGFGHIIAATCFFFAMFYYGGLVIRILLHDNSANLRYAARRHFERFFGLGLKIGILALAVGVVPLVAARINPFLTGGPTAVLSLLGGIGSAIWGHYRTYLSGASSKRIELALSIGSLLLLYGVLISGYLIAQAFVGSGSASAAPDHATRAAILCLFVVSAIVGWFTNLNYLSLHRFYRDRLAEAFMPDVQTTQNRDALNRAAREADELPVCGKNDEKPDAVVNLSPRKGPFHIVCANVILDRSTNERYRARGGDSFILTPLRCGSTATGWVPSCEFAKGELTLASAMAISGAAANPRSGFAGTGATRSSIVSLAMQLLSLRLGYWVVNPRFVRSRRQRANHFSPSATYAFPGVGYTEDSHFLELSDGGHFENLGLYELVRRRCGLIIICDGGQDPDSSYAALTHAALRIKEDFGAILKFNVDLAESGRYQAPLHRSSPGDLVARTRDDEYPRGATFAKRGFFLATIEYSEGGPGPEKALVIYMKSALITELGLVAKAYRGSNPEFPYQSTSDQFFDAEQFEAYREVGYRICDQALRHTGLEYQVLRPQRGSVDTLLNNTRIRTRRR